MQKGKKFMEVGFAKEPDLAPFIEATYLRPEARPEEIVSFCARARTFGFYGVCLPPCYVSLAKESLQGSTLKVITVAGFPLGFSTTKTKVFEVTEAIENGADEVDFVINLGALKAGNYAQVKAEIETIIATGEKALVKVILETPLLTEDEKKRVSLLAREAGAAFVKTATGFHAPGTTKEDVRIIREVIGKEMGLKAAGGIRTWAQAKKLLEAGATRLGTSSAEAIVLEKKQQRKEG